MHNDPSISYIFTADSQGVLKQWAVDEKKLVKNYGAVHSSTITCLKKVEFQNSHYIVTSSKDKSIKIFKVDFITHLLEEKLVYQNAHKSCIYTICPNSNNGKIYSADGFGNLKLWRLSEQRIVADYGQIHNGIIHCICLTKSYL